MGMGFKGLQVREEREALHAEYLRRIDVEQVLDYYNAEHGYRRGDNIIHSCLLDRVDPHHNNGDSNPSASANVEKKVYNCYTYGGGDIFWLIAQMEGKEEFYEIVPMLGQFLTGGVETADDFLEELEKYFRSERPAATATKYHERVLKQWAWYHPYLRDRGVTKEAAELLQIGYDEELVRITIPHWVDGKLLGWQKRSLSDPRWPVTPPEPVRDEKGVIVRYVDPPPKYKNSTDFPKNSTLYNRDRVRTRRERDVVVVESPMSVAIAETYGRTNVLCTFGAKVGDKQIELLREFDSVTVFFDHDDAGRRGAYRLLDGLYRHTATFHIPPEQGKDMADYSMSDLDRIMKSPEPGVLALMELEKTYGKTKRR